MKKGPYEREMARRRRERKRRIRRFHLICLGVMLLAFIIVCVNIFSHKKSIRKEADSLYEAGNYQEALDKFKEAYAEKQWFSDSINVDILLYEADCMMQLQLFSDAELTYLDIQKKYPASKYDKEQLSYLSDLSHALGNYQRGDYVSTVATFTKAVENGHKDISIYAAICYENQKSYDKMKEYLAEKRQTLSEAMEQMQKLEKERKEAEGRRNPLFESKNRLMEFGAEQKERLTEFGAEQKERFAALGFDVRSDKMPDLKELLERFDQMTKPQLPTNWLMRLTTKRYLRAYPHLQGTHHASLKKEEKKVEEKEEKK